jgi:hypothetical protein
MAYLAIRRVRYEGKQYRYESPILKDGLNILEGENGSGKSTFANLVYFGLGGRVESLGKESDRRHSEITNDENNYVELLISIDGAAYTLKRFFGTGDIGISGDDISELLPLHRTESEKRIFSDWILEKLGIEPVLLQYGTYSGRLNFTDLMRLIYHDQAPDPSGIFKAVDNPSYVTDSRVFRRAIFEILVGKSFQDYYSALAEYRTAERAKADTAQSLDLFKEMTRQLGADEDDLNLVFLDKRLDELRSQAKRLIVYRKELAKAPPRQNTAVNLASLQRDLLAIQVRLTGFTRSEAGLLEELSRLEQLKAELVLDATQIKKMIFAHEELRLFSANTCPYCLNEVERVTGRCICGREIKEGEYEKFFYDSSEYLAILKSRQKNVETVESAVSSLKEDLDKLRRDKSTAELNATSIEEQITQEATDTDITINLQRFEEIEHQLADVRDEIARLQQQRELESKREKLEQELQSANVKVGNLKTRVAQLEAAAEADIQKKQMMFSAKYNDLMRQTISDCRTASLAADYMPIINAGEYREASADVPRRLLYFATMLYMSVVDDTVKFPRFLLIDTPETAGIDTENLKASLTRLFEIVNDKDKKFQCQVILTTGRGKYPDGAAAYLFGSLSRESKLLIPKPVPA